MKIMKKENGRKIVIIECKNFRSAPLKYVIQFSFTSWLEVLVCINWRNSKTNCVKSFSREAVKVAVVRELWLHTSFHIHIFCFSSFIHRLINNNEQPRPTTTINAADVFFLSALRLRLHIKCGMNKTEKERKTTITRNQEKKKKKQQQQHHKCQHRIWISTSYSCSVLPLNEF